MARLTRTKLNARKRKGVRRIAAPEAVAAYLDAARQCGDKRTAGRIRRALDAQW